MEKSLRENSLRENRGVKRNVQETGIQSSRESSSRENSLRGIYSRRGGSRESSSRGKSSRRSSSRRKRSGKNGYRGRNTRRKQKSPLRFLLPLLMLLFAGTAAGKSGGKIWENKPDSQTASYGTWTDRAENGTENGIETSNGISYQEENADEKELARRYYYGLLDENAKTIYRELVQGLSEHQETICVKSGDPDLVAEIYGWVYLDYPEFFWINGASHVTGYGEPKNYSDVVPEYTISREEADARNVQIEAAAEDYLSYVSAEMSTYEKIRTIFELCIRRIDYVRDAPENQTLYSGLVNGQTVCAGYSRTFQYLMNRLDIPVIYVTGKTDTGEAHAWNIVQCDGNDYNVDVTWGDPVFAESESGDYNLPDDLIYYDFLCASDDEFSDTHRADENLTLPSCTANDLEYYRQIGRYFETVDETEILWDLETDIEEGKSYSELKFASNELMNQMAAIRAEVLERSSGYLCKIYGLTSVRYTYSEDTATRKLMIFWQYTE